jgi:hypothetical protein
MNIIGSKSQMLDELRFILDISASVAGANELRLVGVSRGRVYGEDLVVTIFKAVCSLRILSEKKKQTSEREIFLMEKILINYQ